MKPLSECKRMKRGAILYNVRLLSHCETRHLMARPCLTESKTRCLIYNPTSGRRRHRRFAEIEQAVRILKDCGDSRRRLAPTTAPMSAAGIARQAVQQGRGMVIACGGDGTINEIVNGLAGSDVPMAVLPAGTANILAKELGIPWDIPQAARLISGGTVRRVALGVAIPAEGRHTEMCLRRGAIFLCVAGAGPDGAIVNARGWRVEEESGDFGVLGRGDAPAF